MNEENFEVERLMNIVLGGIFFVVIIIGYGAIYPDLAGKLTYARIMRSCLYCVVWSIVLSIVVLIATKSGVAETTPLAMIFWSFATFMSIIIGAIGLVGALGHWALHKINPPPETPEKDSAKSNVE